MVWILCFHQYSLKNKFVTIFSASFLSAHCLSLQAKHLYKRVCSCRTKASIAVVSRRRHDYKLCFVFLLLSLTLRTESDHTLSSLIRSFCILCQSLFRRYFCCVSYEAQVQEIRSQFIAGVFWIVSN